MAPTRPSLGASAWSGSGCTPYASGSSIRTRPSTSSTSRRIPPTSPEPWRSSVTPTELVAAEVSVRRAVAEDGRALAALYTAARADAVPQMPPALHTAEEDVAFYSRRLTDDDVTAWIAEADGELLGFALCTPTFLDGLYVRPDLKGQGIGSLLL